MVYTLLVYSLSLYFYVSSLYFYVSQISRQTFFFLLMFVLVRTGDLTARRWVEIVRPFSQFLFLKQRISVGPNLYQTGNWTKTPANPPPEGGRPTPRKRQRFVRSHTFYQVTWSQVLARFLDVCSFVLTQDFFVSATLAANKIGDLTKLSILVQNESFWSMKISVYEHLALFTFYRFTHCTKLPQFLLPMFLFGAVE